MAEGNFETNQPFEQGSNEGKDKEKLKAFNSYIELNFLRHDAKEGANGRHDDEVPLTEAGRKHAKEMAEIEDPKFAVAFGGPKERSGHTALFHMMGKNPEITGTETFEELKEKTERLTGYPKFQTNQRLNFLVDERTPYGIEAMTRYMKGEYLKFLVEDSDKLAADLGDKENSTYSRQAGQIAQIIKKYVEISPKVHALVKRENDADPDNIEDTMRRFLGTHNGVGESFLAKVLEMKKGVEARDEFVKLDKKGFGFSEGFKVRLINEGEPEPKIEVSYRKKGKDGAEDFEMKEELSSRDLEEMIKAGEN